MNLFDNIKKINELIDKNVERLQFLVKQLNTDFKAKSNLFTVDEFVFKPELFQEIAQFLELDFDNQSKQAGNVCFANDKDLRSEFKDSFSAEDVLNCLYAVLHLENENSLMHANSVSTVFQKNNTTEIQNTFWKLVEVGDKARNNKI